MIKTIILKLIRLYQRTLSPDTGLMAYKHPNGYCKYHPHCSEYAYQSINKHGLFKGFYLSIKRIFKCHPFSKGGYDPIK
ncbi:MAG TPA: membrane protein insertion efficiency factor YidD [Patescibacteria group bacterium]|nr:membrane protein insertion efficiency factor YidD [Patescibacteria group bacterium]